MKIIWKDFIDLPLSLFVYFSMVTCIDMWLIFDSLSYLKNWFFQGKRQIIWEIFLFVSPPLSFSFEFINACQVYNLCLITTCLKNFHSLFFKVSFTFFFISETSLKKIFICFSLTVQLWYVCVSLKLLLFCF